MPLVFSLRLGIPLKNGAVRRNSDSKYETATKLITFSEKTVNFATFRRGSNPYLIVNNAFEGIPAQLNLQEGLKYGISALDWDSNDAEDFDFLEELTMWVLFHQIKQKLICYQM